MRIALSAVCFLAAEFVWWPVAARRASSHSYPTLLHLVVLRSPKSMLVGSRYTCTAIRRAAYLGVSCCWITWAACQAQKQPLVSCSPVCAMLPCWAGVTDCCGMWCTPEIRLNHCGTSACSASIGQRNWPSREKPILNFCRSWIVAVHLCTRDCRKGWKGCMEW